MKAAICIRFVCFVVSGHQNVVIQRHHHTYQKSIRARVRPIDVQILFRSFLSVQFSCNSSTIAIWKWIYASIGKHWPTRTNLLTNEKQNQSNFEMKKPFDICFFSSKIFFLFFCMFYFHYMYIYTRRLFKFSFFCLGLCECILQYFIEFHRYVIFVVHESICIIRCHPFVCFNCYSVLSLNRCLLL